jgi:hypothetical protein
MRKYEISPAIITAMRSRALAAPFREAGVPLYLEAPRYDNVTPAYVEYEADDLRTTAHSYTLEADEDDDFY